MPSRRGDVLRVSAVFLGASVAVLAISVALGFDAIVSVLAAFVITPIIGAVVLSRWNDDGR